jgi:hypothetical protein
MKTSRVLVTALVAVLGAGMLAACDDSPPPPPPPTIRTSTNTTAALTPLKTSDSACRDRLYPNGLTMMPETAAEAAVLDTLVACTANPGQFLPYGVGIYLENTDDNAVWVVDRPATAAVPVSTDSALRLQYDAFAALPRIAIGVPLPPHTVMRIPAINPITLHMRLDTAVQAAWQVVSLSVESVANRLSGTLDSKIRAAGIQVLSAGSPSRAAVLTCASLAFDSARAIDNASAGTKLKKLETALDVGSNISTCGSAISTARKARVVAGFSGVEIAETAAKSSGWLKAESFFSISGRAVKWAEVVLKVVK